MVSSQNRRVCLSSQIPTAMYRGHARLATYEKAFSIDIKRAIVWHICDEISTYHPNIRTAQEQKFGSELYHRAGALTVRSET